MKTIKDVVDALLIAGALTLSAMVAQYVIVRDCNMSGHFNYGGLVYRCSVDQKATLIQQKKDEELEKASSKPKG